MDTAKVPVGMVSRFRGIFAISPSRNLEIETLRGLACLLLVFYHVVGADAGEGLRISPDSPWRYVVDTLGYVRMPLFSFLSGFVYAYRPVTSSTSLPKFWRGKARRLIVPMLFIGTAFALVQTYLPGANNPIQTPWYLWHVLPIGPYWFLESMLWVFVITALLEFFGLLKRVEVSLGIVFVAILLDVLIPDTTNWLGWRTALYLLPFFLAGVLASRFNWRATPVPVRVAVVTTTVLLLMITQLGLFGLLDRVPLRHAAIATLCGIGVCLSLLLLRWKWKALVFIGAFSFTIYTCQVFGAVAARVGLQRLGVNNDTLNIFLGLLAGITLPILIELIARRSAVLSTIVLGQKWKPRSKSSRGQHAAPRPFEPTPEPAKSNSATEPGEA